MPDGDIIHDWIPTRQELNGIPQLQPKERFQTPHWKKEATACLKVMAKHPYFEGKVSLVEGADPNEPRSWWPEATPEDANDCPFSVPLKYRHYHPSFPSKYPPRKKWWEKWPDLAQQISDNKLFPMSVMRAMLEYQDKSPYMFIEYGEGEGQFVPCLTRVHQAYINEQKQVIRERCKALEALPGTALFLTGTFKHKKVPADLPDFWEMARGLKSKALQRLRKLGRCSYVWVVEAHNSGFPHWHCLIKYHNRKEGHFIGKNGKWRLQDNNRWKEIRQALGLNNDDVQVVRDGSVASYLTKYVAKSLNSIDPSWFRKGVEPSAAHRKALFSIAMPILFNWRIHGASADLTHKEKVEEKRFDEKDFAQLEAAAALPKVEPGDDGALIKALNKSHEFCHSRAWLPRGMRQRQDYYEDYGFYDDLQPQEIALIKWKGCTRGCPGCSLTSFTGASLSKPLVVVRDISDVSRDYLGKVELPGSLPDEEYRGLAWINHSKGFISKEAWNAKKKYIKTEEEETLLFRARHGVKNEEFDEMAPYVPF